MLTREDFLKADPHNWEEMELERLGGSIWVRGFTAAERDKFEMEAVAMSRGDTKTLQNFRARHIVSCIAGEDKKPLFGARDAELIGNLDAATVNSIFDKVRALSGMSDEDLKEFEKN